MPFQSSSFGLLNMENQAEIHKRLKWIRLYEKTQNAGMVCLRSGISRPTLKKWTERYKRHGEEGLRSHSRRPHSSPALKAFGGLKDKILVLRKERNLGARRIQNELIRVTIQIPPSSFVWSL